MTFFCISQSFECNVDDLENDGDYAELGRGQYGSVYRMRHKPTNTIMAVKVTIPVVLCVLGGARLHLGGGGGGGARLHLTVSNTHTFITNVVYRQRIRATIDKNARKSLLMDLKVCMKATGCPYTITFYGALFREVSRKLLI